MNKSEDKENLLSYPQEIVKLLNTCELFGRDERYDTPPCSDGGVCRR